MSTENTTVTVADKGAITYQVAGQDVKLSYQIVRDFLTKGTGAVSDQDLTQFISICKYNQLNPFLGEAYLVKFGSAPAQMIVSKEAFFKRADANENFEGIRAGVIVIREGNALELEGAFFLKTDELVGGWAEVYIKDRKHPVIAKVSLDEYDKKQSTWNEKKSTMISKVAKVQALREAFPAQLGAMYTQEEQTQAIEITHEEISSEIQQNGNKTQLDFAEEATIIESNVAEPIKEEKPKF
jgi:phage recombination protein Bet